MTKLYTRNYGGNIHATATAINKQGLAEFVLTMQSSGLNTVVVFKMPTAMVHALRQKNPSFCGEPDYDNPINS
jgi:hypothetical protein